MIYYLPLDPKATFDTTHLEKGDAKKLAPELFDKEGEYTPDVPEGLLRMVIAETYLRDPKRIKRVRLPEEDPSAGDVIITGSTADTEKVSGGESYGVLKVLEVREENHVRVFSLLVSKHVRHEIGVRKTWGRDAITPAHIDDLIK